MSGLWGIGEAAVPHVINWQVRGKANPSQAAQIAAGGAVESMWYGPMQQEPYRSSDSMPDQLSVMDRINAFLPETAAIRMPFNISHWGTYGTQYDNTGLLASTATFLAAMAQRGIKAHWCLMDGPSQRDGTELPHPTQATKAAWQAWADALSARQVASHQRLVTWTNGNPASAPLPWAVEAINEPDSYNVMGLRVGDLPWARAIYAQHVVAIWEQVYAQASSPFDAAWFFVGGWNYSANFSGLTIPNAYLPGGVSALQYIRDRVPAARLCWSLHAYPDWVGGATQSQSRQNLRRRLGGLAPTGIEGDRVLITEVNARHDGLYRYNADGVSSDLNLVRNATWMAEKGIGIGWWTGANYAQARLIQIQQGTGTRIEEGWSHANYHYYTGARNNPVYSVAEQNGEVPLTVDQPISAWWPSDDEADLKAPGIMDANGGLIGITRLARGHGGRGACVLRGKSGSANLLYGGDGPAALIGGGAPCLDFLALGRGGGVARSSDALQAIIYGSTHRPSRLYLSSGRNTVVLMEGADSPATIVINPQSTAQSVIHGLDFARGDRISFRGAFASAAAVRDAIRIEAVARQGEDIVVMLPAGGSVRLAGCFAVAPSFPTYCLDLTDGWYGAGWTEPPDYDPTLITMPAPDASELVFDPQTFDQEAGGISDEDSSAFPIRVYGGGDAVLRWQGQAISMVIAGA